MGAHDHLSNTRSLYMSGQRGKWIAPLACAVVIALAVFLWKKQTEITDPPSPAKKGLIVNQRQGSNPRASKIPVKAVSPAERSQTESVKFFSGANWEINLAELESKIGHDQAVKLINRVGSYIEDFNGKVKGGALLEQNGHDLRISFPPQGSGEEAAALRKEFLASINGFIPANEVGKQIADMVLTHVEASTGNFGGSPRMVIAKYNDASVDLFQRYSFFDYTLNAEHASPGDLSNAPLVGATEHPAYFNVREYRANTVPLYFHNFLYSDKGEIGVEVE